MPHGLFITFEGPEGAGKSTQIKLLREWLENKGRKCLVTREPGGTPLAERLREIIKYHQHEDICAESELMLIAAGRSQHVRKVIVPALKEGCVVICDRFSDSTVAYQGGARGLDMKMVETLNAFAVGNCRVDLTILLDLPVEEGFKRVHWRDANDRLNDRLEGAGLEFHRRVRATFLKIAEAEPQRVKVICALEDIMAVHHKITKLVENAIS